MQKLTMKDLNASLELWHAMICRTLLNMHVYCAEMYGLWINATYAPRSMLGG